MKEFTVYVYVDGLCEPRNPLGVATYGFVVYDNDRKVHEEYGVVGAGFLGDDVSNNVAEYTAVSKALEWLLKNKMHERLIEIRSDSQLLVRQLQGYYSVRAPRIVPLYKKVVDLERSFRMVKYVWIPREYNIEADELSRRAYYDFCRKHDKEIREHYGAYLITEKQKAFIKRLASRKGIEVKVSDYMSKREASKLISSLLKE